MEVQVKELIDKIKTDGIKNAENKYTPGTSYPSFKIIDID